MHGQGGASLIKLLAVVVGIVVSALVTGIRSVLTRKGRRYGR